ncbi:MAG: hypothetical protein C4298_06125 [Thermus sp.]|uniref:hypothetical protein n=1 Tax=Thermus sp. TaxID=275 RepID=UPI00331B61BC
MKHEHEGPNLLSRWRVFAREYGVHLLDELLESASASGKRPENEKRTEPARPKSPSFRRPSLQSTLLLANVSVQVVPLYAAYPSFAPQEVYLVSTMAPGLYRASWERAKAHTSQEARRCLGRRGIQGKSCSSRRRRTGKGLRTLTFWKGPMNFSKSGY